ncbi:MAG: hypothetical protein ACK41O_26540, partial [Runella zeae]
MQHSREASFSEGDGVEAQQSSTSKPKKTFQAKRHVTTSKADDASQQQQQQQQQKQGTKRKRNEDLEHKELWKDQLPEYRRPGLSMHSGDLKVEQEK